MALHTEIDLQIRMRETGAFDLGTRSAEHLLRVLATLPSGTADGKADIGYSDSRSLATTSEELDILNSLTGALGDTIAISELVAVAIVHRSAAGTLTVGNATSPITGLFGGPTETIVIQPGGAFIWFAPNAGLAIGPGTTDKLKIDASAAINYDIAVIGRSS